MPMSTPWGPAQQQKTLGISGVILVETAGHGGIMVRKNVAERLLSPAALAVGEQFTQGRWVDPDKMYYCYEEDCSWAVALIELRNCWPKYYQGMRPATDAEREASMTETIRRWHPECLMARAERLKTEADENLRRAEAEFAAAQEALRAFAAAAVADPLPAP